MLVNVVWILNPLCSFTSPLKHILLGPTFVVCVAWSSTESTNQKAVPCCIILGLQEYLQLCAQEQFRDRNRVVSMWSYCQHSLSSINYFLANKYSGYSLQAQLRQHLTTLSHILTIPTILHYIPQSFVDVTSMVSP